MSYQPKNDQDSSANPKVHTEVRDAPNRATKAHTLKPRTPLQAIPDPLDEDAVEDLFNDMPV